MNACLILSLSKNLSIPILSQEKSQEAVVVLSFAMMTYKRFVKFLYKALFTFTQKPKIFQDSPSHRMFRRMNGVLNIGKNKN